MNSLQEIFTCVLDKIKQSERFSDPTFNLWFSDLKLERLTETHAYISAASDFKARIVLSRYTKTLKEFLSEILGFEVELVILCNNNALEPEEDPDAPPPAMEQSPPRPLFSPENDPLDDVEEEKNGEIDLNENPRGIMLDYTFENFIVGNTNKFAHAVCLNIAGNVGGAREKYNPLLLYGASGLGKTHLLYAITNQIKKDNNNVNFKYVRGEDFANDLINSISKKIPMQYFRDRYRKVDVLLVDDIQFIAGKVAVQEEFFHTFNTLYEEKKQIILSSDRPPKDMQTLEERLKARFEWGLMVDIQPPDLELRIAILKRKAQNMSIAVPNDVLYYLAENIKSNIRQLEGAMKRLCAYCAVNDTVITLDVAKTCITDLISGSVPVSVTVDTVFEKVSSFYNVPIEEIRGKKRKKEISSARHIAIYILREKTALSLNEIGAVFADLDHTSVLYAYNKICDEISSNPSFEHEIGKLIRQIKG